MVDEALVDPCFCGALAFLSAQQVQCILSPRLLTAPPTAPTLCTCGAQVWPEPLEKAKGGGVTVTLRTGSFLKSTVLIMAAGGEYRVGLLEISISTESSPSWVDAGTLAPSQSTRPTSAPPLPQDPTVQ